jgi:hypothetical protein
VLEQAGKADVRAEALAATLAATAGKLSEAERKDLNNHPAVKEALGMKV